MVTSMQDLPSNHSVFHANQPERLIWIPVKLWLPVILPQCIFAHTDPAECLLVTSSASGVCLLDFLHWAACNILVSSNSGRELVTWYLKSWYNPNLAANSTLSNSDPENIKSECCYHAHHWPSGWITKDHCSSKPKLRMCLHKTEARTVNVFHSKSPHFCLHLTHRGCNLQDSGLYPWCTWDKSPGPSSLRESIAFGNTPGTGVRLVKDVGQGRVTYAPTFMKYTLRITGSILPNL